METIKILELDLRGTGITPTVRAVQYDTGRAVRAMLAGTQGTIGKARVYCQKPSGKETYTEGTVLNDACVLFGLTDQMVAETGVTKAQLHLMDGSRVVTSFDFNIEVTKNRVALSSITSQDDYQALKDILARLETYDPIPITELEIDNLDESGGENPYAINVAKAYGSVDEMEGSFASDGLPDGSHVIINAGSTELPDNGKVYKKRSTGYEFVVDLSGPAGKDGTGVNILGSYDAEEDLKQEHPTGTKGDAYLIGGDLYVWDGTQWKNVGRIQGPAGPQGAAATITVGTVTTKAAGSEATVTNSGTESAAVLDFGIPQGPQGETGDIEGIQDIEDSDIDALGGGAS